MRTLSLRWWILLFVLVLAGALVAVMVIRNRPSPYPGSEPDHADLFYADESDPRRSLDVYLPAEGDLPAPVVVMLHGNRGDKTNFRYTADQFTPEGFAVVLPSFRIDPITYSDAFCALAWVHAHADAYRFNADQVYVVGWSSGGGIATEMIATNDPNSLLEDCPYEAASGWLAAAVLLAAGSDRWPESGWREDVPPVIWIDGNEPPVLLMHGEQDPVIPAEDSSQLAAMFDDAGDEFELILLPEADHLFALPGSAGYEEMLQEVVAFLSEQAQS